MMMYFFMKEDRDSNVQSGNGEVEEAIRTKVTRATLVLMTTEPGLWTDVYSGAQVGVAIDDLADSSEIVATVYKCLLLIGFHGKGNANTNEQDKHEWEHFFHSKGFVVKN
jgi:hypothetical protein